MDLEARYALIQQNQRFQTAVQVHAVILSIEGLKVH